MMIPDFTNLSTWASSLIIDFPYDNIPFLIDEENWKDWGNSLVQENSFSENNAPGTESYDNWKSWASTVFFTMANT